MITSNINFKQLEDRIDAEYYKPEYLEVFNVLGKTKETLQSISQIITKGETPLWRGNVYVSEGIPFLRVVNFVNEELDLSNIVYIPEFVHERMKRSQLKPDDVLFSMAGRIGTAVIVPQNLEIANINQAVAKIRLKENVINKYYLAVFLNSKFGHLQSLRKASGGVQNNINFEDIKSIKIFLPPQSFQLQIEKMVKEAEEKRKLAEEKYKEAEEVLNKELGIEDLDLSTQKTFETKFSEIDRLDPEQYQPKYKVILDHLNKIQHTEINKIAMFNQRGVQPEYTNRVTGYMALTSKCIGKKYIDYDSMPNITEDFYYSSKEAKLTNGDMVIYTTGAYVGNTQAITGDINAIASNHVNILRVKDFDPVFLSFYFNSIPGQLQIKKLVSGAAQAELYPRDIEKIIVPKISTSTQQKISKLIQESFCFRKESKKLINDAKRKVEEMIEK